MPNPCQYIYSIVRIVAGVIVRRSIQHSSMSKGFDSVRDSENLIKKLMTSIEEATASMSSTFEETVLRHEEQFIKCYRLKIYELVKLLQELKSTIEDKFINNALAMQLETVLKERDYFKYECLKLNSQHQSLLDDHKNLAAQSSNASEQIAIYKHLLQTQKLKSSQIENNVQQLKNSLSEIALRGVPEPRNTQENRLPQLEKEMVRLKKEIREKNEVIRALRERVHDLQRAAALQHEQKVEKKDLYELWRICVESWRREALARTRKEDTKTISFERLSSSSKKQLLRTLFTHGQFLKFIQRLLFDEGFRVVFESTEEHYMERNRAKLFNYMSKKRIMTAEKALRI